jgi:meso-butanediol dehydrogenase / (S,S)-butanediol dehydrogenase / diacetyl reductase
LKANNGKSEQRRRLQDRVALITGGGSGIGASIADQFTQEGAKVILCGRREHVIKAKVQALQAQGYAGLDLAGDVATDAAALVRQGVEHFGRLDILVNNAAVAAGATVDEMTSDMWRHVLSINLDAAFELVRRALPHLIASKGNILHISSIGAVSGEFDDVAYAASKAGLEGFSRRLTLEVARYGVRSNVIRPGLIDTEAFADMPADFFEAQIPQIPLTRIGKPHDIARAAAFLCSDEANFITGAVLTIDGGESAK